MMENTNNEKITPAESSPIEKLAASAELSSNEGSNANNDTDNSENNAADNTANNTAPTDTPLPPRKRVGWYDIIVFVLMFLSSQILGGFIALKLGVLPADSTLFESADFEIVEQAEQMQARFVATSLFIAMLLCFAMLRIYRLIRNWKIKLTGRVPDWASPFRLLCGYLLMWCISIAIEPLTSILPDSQTNIGSGGWLLISAVLIAPIFEEYLFRGYVAGAIQYAYGSVAAWLISSIVFGVAHGQPAVMLSATMSGLVLGFYFLRYRSIVLPMILHAMNNITVCFLHTFDADELTLRQLIGDDSLYWCIQVGCSIISLVALVRMFFIIRGVKNEKYIS